MAMRQIKPEERRIIVDEVAKGASLREAMKKTSIKSSNTAMRIAKAESHTITQKRISLAEMAEKRQKLRDNAILDEIEAGLSATKRFDKEIVDKDYHVKHKYLTTLLQIKGHLAQNPMGVQVNTFLVDRSDKIELE